MSYIMKTIGHDKPSVALVGCLHGDEVLGKKVIDELEDVKLKRGSLSFIIANTPALAKNKRFIKKDLNRSFPGKRNGEDEEKLAYCLEGVLKDFDYVIDIHATDSDVGALVIVTSLNKNIKNFLKHIPITKVVLMKKSNFSKGSMIDFCRAGISLEYGPDKTGRNYKKVLMNVRSILKNVGLLSGKKELFLKKELYTVSGTYSVASGFKQNNKLRNFCLIKVGQVIGDLNGEESLSKKEFYPLFLGKGAYKRTLALVADKKEKIVLED